MWPPSFSGLLKISEITYLWKHIYGLTSYMSYYLAFCLRNSKNYFVMNVPSHTVSNNVNTRIIIML